MTAREKASCDSLGYLSTVSSVDASVKVCTKRAASTSRRTIRLAGSSSVARCASRSARSLSAAAATGPSAAATAETRVGSAARVSGAFATGSSDAIRHLRKSAGSRSSPPLPCSYLKNERTMDGAWLAIDRACAPSCCLTCRACSFADSFARSASTRLPMPLVMESLS
jgi:hypothetical protein